jgi:hypothetical protein
VGAPFAVLVAEEFVHLRLPPLVGLTSAGQITTSGPPPYVVIIDRALRDEGTSYHYAVPVPGRDGKVCARGTTTFVPLSARAGRRMRRFARPPRQSNGLVAMLEDIASRYPKSRHAPDIYSPSFPATSCLGLI